MEYVGIDLGSSYTKGVLINSQRKIVSEAVIKTGVNFTAAAKKIYEILNSNKSLVATTGVGRNNCDFKNFSKPEINCLSKGAYFHYPQKSTVIDIGGQDNKIVKIDSNGKQLSFKMNRKCAAGTGSFLEEIALKLDCTTAEMNKMALSAGKTVNINSYCTVFAGTEIIHHIRSGQKINEIILGIYNSIVKRVSEMESITTDVILTGGAIAHNSILKKLFTLELPKCSITTPPNPQNVGALGASLYALENDK